MLCKSTVNNLRAQNYLGHVGQSRDPGEQARRQHSVRGGRVRRPVQPLPLLHWIAGQSRDG